MCGGEGVGEGTEVMAGRGGTIVAQIIGGAWWRRGRGAVGIEE